MTTPPCEAGVEWIVFEEAQVCHAHVLWYCLAQCEASEYTLCTLQCHYLISARTFLPLRLTTDNLCGYSRVFRQGHRPSTFGWDQNTGCEELRRSQQWRMHLP
jgi:hypothetical protein